ncbi:hypothetical protein HYC85_027675 [Camellia sinensis]|uniref:Peptide deformylase n=1 Tax=Camellia sinensis TaxID=4442 RepID=A0A7J7FX38_CAMSI|nr:hypothetical protein HYC85_027675 [Camellia sinensis]
MLPEIVKAGDPVLHEAAREVPQEEIGSDKIQRLLMIWWWINRGNPQDWCPLEETKGEDKLEKEDKIIVNPKIQKKSNKSALFFEGCLSSKLCSDHRLKGTVDREKLYPTILTELKTVSGQQTNDRCENAINRIDSTENLIEKMKVQWESVDGFRAVVERHLEVEVSHDGQPIKARILQHKCDHLDGTLYVDKMVPRTFRTVKNLELPLPIGSPKLGVL